MLGLGRGFRMDAADEIDEALYDLALGGFRNPEPLERLAIGAIGIGELDHLRRAGRPDHQRIGRIDGAKTLSRARILGHRGDVEAVLVIDRREQQVTALRREIDDAPARYGLIDRPFDGRRCEVLEGQVGEGLAQLTLGVRRRRGQEIGRRRHRRILGKSGCPRDQQRGCQQFIGTTHAKPPWLHALGARRCSYRA